MTIAERLLSLTHEAKRMGFEQQRLHVALGVCTSMSSTIFSRLCMRLLECEPHLSVTVATLHSTEMYDEIDTRQVDLAFSLLERAHPSVSVRPCFSEPMLGIRLAGADCEDGQTVRIEDLDPGLELYFPWTPLYQIWHCEHCTSGAMRVTVDDPHLLFTLLQKPDQWAIVPLSIARYFRRRGRYAIFQVTPRPPDRICYRLAHKYPRPHAQKAITLTEGYLDQILACEFGPDCEDVGVADLCKKTPASKQSEG